MSLHGVKATRIILVSLAVLTALATALASAEGPVLTVSSPVDGDFSTSRTVEVRGTTAPADHTLNLEGDDFAHGQAAGTTWDNGRLAFRPKLVFTEDFDGDGLDTSKWEVVGNEGCYTVDNGLLKLFWTYPEYKIPLIRNRVEAFPADGDFLAAFDLAYASYGYGSGGGISQGSPDVDKTLIGVYTVYEIGQPIYRVYCNGERVYSQMYQDLSQHTYELRYSADDGRYTGLLDGVELSSYSTDIHPDRFWFGPNGMSSIYYHSPVSVDMAKVWSTSGTWTSDPIELDGSGIMDGAIVNWSSNNEEGARVTLEMRTSEDATTWGEWTTVTDGVPDQELQGSWVQVRTKLAFPSGGPSNRVQVSAIDIRFHYPLETVEVRRAGGDWVGASGLDEWTAQLALLEGENEVQVRATDTSGAWTSTSIDVLVDTVPPTGSMQILGEAEYINDVSVRLALEAQDEYGVAYVELANDPDFIEFQRFPYASTVDWQLDGTEGTCSVFARFVDTHGLVSGVSSDSVVFDTVPPVAFVLVEGGEVYTSDTTVDLALTYSDNLEVSRVELSNDPAFQEPVLVPVGHRTYEGWELLPGEDGDRTVYMRVTDLAGNVELTQDAIELVNPKEIGSILIEGGAEHCARTNVLLTIQVPLQPRLRLMQLSNEPGFEDVEWEEVEKERWWLLPPDDGERTVYMRFLDHRDIVSLPVSDSIFLDTTPPQVEVTLNGGAAYTLSTDIDVKVAYQDALPASRMWLTRDGAYNDVDPVDFSPSICWTLPEREADHHVYVRVEDAAGNAGEGVAVIHYATICPRISLELPDGRYVGDVDTVPVSISPTDPYGPIEVQLAFGREPMDSDPWVTLNGRVDVPVPANARDGGHTICARARNVPGLVSEPVSIDLIIDTVAPEVLIRSPEDGQTFVQRELDVLFEVETIDHVGLAWAMFGLDDAEERELPHGLYSTELSIDDYGEHVITVTAEDVAGNVALETTSFSVVDADDVSKGLGGLATVAMLSLVGILGGLGVAALRYLPHHGPSVMPGDGWEELHTAKEVEALEAAKVRPHDAPQDAGDELGVRLEEVAGVHVPEAPPDGSSEGWVEFTGDEPPPDPPGPPGPSGPPDPQYPPDPPGPDGT